MWFYKTILALWFSLLALIYISSASTKTQTRRPILVDVDDVMTREYTETVFTYEVVCAAATSASQLYCYNAPRCLSVLSSYGDIRGPMTPGWTCKTGESSLQNK